MSKNTVLFTRQPEMRTGQLFDVNPKAKGSEKGMIPLKETALLKERLKNSDDKAAVINAWTDKYGGYNSLAISHFALIRYLDRRKYVFRFIPIPVIRVSELLCSENLIKYCVDELKLNNVEVIRSKVLINTLVSINGFKMTISGRSGDKVIMYSAIPLYLSDKDTAYVKRLEKFLKEKKQDKNKQVKEFDGITYEDNVNLYKILLAKSKLSLYKDRPASQLGVLEEGASVFEGLSIEDQTSVLLNIINYLGMDSGQADLKLIKGSPNSGKLRISSKIDLEKISFSIVDQSITGIFEKKTEFKL